MNHYSFYLRIKLHHLDLKLKQKRSYSVSRPTEESFGVQLVLNPSSDKHHTLIHVNFALPFELYECWKPAASR